MDVSEKSLHYSLYIFFLNFGSVYSRWVSFMLVVLSGPYFILI